MRKSTGVMAIAMLLLLGTMLPATADNHGLPSEQGDDILDEDAIDIEVAICPTDMDDIPGVTGAGLENPFGQIVYRAPWQFLDDFEDRDDANDNMTRVSWYRNGDHWGTWTDIDVSEGFDGNWYPPYPSDHATHAIAYAFQDGTVWTAEAHFDDNGCITEDGVTWTEHGPDVNVNITGDENLVVDEVGSYTVTTTSETETPFPNAWQLALEVEGDVSSADDLSISWGGRDLELEYDSDAEVVYVYGLSEAALLDDDSQSFEAIFHEDGSFTGTVFAINLREAHADLDLKNFVDNH